MKWQSVREVIRMAETLSTLSHIFFTVAGTAFALAVFLWFFLKVPKVMADLRGPAARRPSAGVREKHKKAGKKWRCRNAEKAARQTATGDDTDSKELLVNEEVTVLLADEEATVLLTDEEATVLLQNPAPLKNR